MNTESLEEIAERGWTQLSVSSEEELLSVGCSLGEVSRSRPRSALLETLTPRNKAEARPGSMSSIVGLSSMPLHTDGAFNKPPARWLFLWSKGAYPKCGTTLIDSFGLLSGKDRCDLENGIWGIRGGGNSFVTSVLFEGILRWDPCCMWPLDRTAKRASKRFEGVLEMIKPRVFQWENPDTVLVIDNWRMLHGREAAGQEPNRQLVRMLINPATSCGNTNL